MTEVLVATDLDRTLIYSRAASQSPEPAGDAALVCVERYDGADASFVTRSAAALIGLIADRSCLVPVTTRTPEQLARVRLSIAGAHPSFAIAANGGFLLVQGEPDDGWTARVTERLRAVAALDEVWAYATARCSPAWTHSLRRASEMFCYAVVDRAALPSGFLAEVTQWAEAVGWRTSLQGRKLYWIPQPLTKSAAVAEVARRLDRPVILATGDSLLDIDLLQAADLGIHPAHGELAECGWAAPHVVRTRSAGVRAGEEICHWLLDQIEQLGAGGAARVLSRPAAPATGAGPR